MRNDIYLYILIMAAVTFLIRVLPLTIIRRPIKSRFLRSFLYYVPYVTLSVMTFPAILSATQSVYSAAAAFIAAVLASWFGGGLVGAAASACAVVFLIETLL